MGGQRYKKCTYQICQLSQYTEKAHPPEGLGSEKGLIVDYLSWMTKINLKVLMFGQPNAVVMNLFVHSKHCASSYWGGHQPRSKLSQDTNLHLGMQTRDNPWKLFIREIRRFAQEVIQVVATWIIEPHGISRVPYHIMMDLIDEICNFRSSSY